MTGWVVMLGLAAAVATGLWPFFRRSRATAQLLGAALLLALAGYAWQGRPALEGSPKPPAPREALPESAFEQDRQDMLGRFDRAWYWLNISDAFARRGDTQSAASVIRSGLREAPRDADLWVGLGNALVAHADGLMTPAAQLAFDRAATLAPDHPGPKFFYGLSLAQGGGIAEAERIWRQLLADAPEEAGYRRILEERLAAIDQARRLGRLPPPPAEAGPAAPPSPAE